MRHCTTRIAALVVCSAFCTTAVALAAEYNPTDGAQLQAALDAAELSAEDDVIHLLAATTYSTNAAGQDFRFVSQAASGALTIDGEGPTSSLLDGNGVRRVLTIETDHDVVLSDVGLVNGSLTLAGGSGDLEGAGALINVRGGPACPPLNLTLDNVRIADSHASATDMSVIGGIAYLNVPCGVLTLTDVTFGGNHTTQAGSSSVLGGILRTGNNVSDVSTVITNLTFTGNSVVSGGGGPVYGGLADFNTGALSIAGMTIGAHTVTSSDIGASDSLGAILSIFSGDGDLLLSDVSMIGATAQLSGDLGGEQVRGGLISINFGAAETVLLERFWLEGNTFVDTGLATVFGGLLYLNPSPVSQPNPSGTVTFRSSRVLGNQVTSLGQSLGLLWIGAERIVDVVNNAVGNNRVTVTGPGDVLGGALLGAGEPLTLVHNTFWNNVLASPVGNTAGGGLFVGNGGTRVDLYNNIAWGNTATTGADVRLFGSAFEVNLSHNDIGVLSMEGETVVLDQGNVSVDPVFASGGADFHLGLGSPVIDAGDPAAPLIPLLDLDGDPRVIPPAPDMGADEAVGGGIPPEPEPIPALSWPALVVLASLLAIGGYRLAR